MLRNHKNKLDFKSSDFYKSFKRKFKTNPRIKVSQNEYTLILKSFFSLVVHQIIHESLKFKIPSLGQFYLVKIKQGFRRNHDGTIKFEGSVNWPETKKLIAETGDKTKRVYYMNDGTDRYVYKITWDKFMLDFINKTYYTFIINKKHRQYLNQVILKSDKPLNAYVEWYQ